MCLKVLMWVPVDSLLAHQVQQITSQTPTSPDVQATSAAVKKHL